jgi:hypothetical protein
VTPIATAMPAMPSHPIAPASITVPSRM